MGLKISVYNIVSLYNFSKLVNMVPISREGATRDVVWEHIITGRILYIPSTHVFPNHKTQFLYNIVKYNNCRGTLGKG